ncbi:MAG: DMT family transporter [Burkholderiales bacterium]
MLFALASAPCFAMSAIFGKFALNAGGSPIGVLAARFVLAAAILAVLLVLMGKRWPRGRTLCTLLAVGAIGQGAMAIFFFNALTHASAGLTGLLLYLHPALIALVEVLARWERMRPMKAVAIVLAVVGCALTAGGGGGSALGVFFGIAAAVSLSVYVLAAKRYAHDIDPYVSTTVFIAGAALVFVVMAAFTQPAMPQGAVGWSAVVGLAVVPTVVGSLFLFAALPRLAASDVTTLMTIEPVVTMIFGWWLLGETVGLFQFAGAVLILGSVLVLAQSVRRV